DARRVKLELGYGYGRNVKNVLATIDNLVTFEVSNNLGVVSDSVIRHGAINQAHLTADKHINEAINVGPKRIVKEIKEGIEDGNIKLNVDDVVSEDSFRKTINSLKAVKNDSILDNIEINNIDAESTFLLRDDTIGDKIKSINDIENFLKETINDAKVLR